MMNCFLRKLGREIVTKVIGDSNNGTVFLNQHDRLKLLQSI
jgi:hypothetical protein